MYAYSVLGIPAQAGTTQLTAEAASPFDVIYMNGQLVAQLAPFSFSLPRGPGQLALLVVLPFPGTSPPQRLAPGMSVGYNTSYSVQTLRPACAQIDELRLEGAPTVLSPGFSPPELSYVLTVGQAVASLEIEAILSRALPGSTLTICGVPAVSGQPTLCQLPAGNGTVVITATSAARFGSCVTDYVLALERPSASRLLAIQLTPGQLEPSFDPGQFLYTLFVDPAVLALPGTLQALVQASPGVTVTVGGIFITIGVAFPLAAAECQTLIFMAFSEGDPLGTPYRVIVTSRPLPRLESLTLAPSTLGYLLPEYSSNETEYVARLSARGDGTVCYVFGIAAGQTLVVDGLTAVSGQPLCFNATVGVDSSVVAVLSANETCYGQTGYSLTARVSPLPYLVNISTSPQEITPQPFDPESDLYSVTVPFLQRLLFVTATLPPEYANSTITVVDPATRALRPAVSGEAERINVPLGSRSPLLVRVTDGDAVRTYTIRTIRPPPISFTLAMLTDLNVTLNAGPGDTTGALAPAFDPNILQYRRAQGRALLQLKPPCTAAPESQSQAVHF